MAFPPVRSMFGFPYAATASISIGGSYDAVQYPPYNMTDGSARRSWVSNYGSTAVTLTLSGSLPCNFFAVFGHNLDHDLICSVTSNNGFLRGVGVKDPGFWLDLRDLAGTPHTASAWTLNISTNSRPAKINEIAVGLASECEGVVRGGPVEEFHGYQVREELEYGKVYRSAYGSVGRTMRLQIIPTTANRAALAAVDAEAMSLDITKRVVVIPDSLVNDPWLVDWPSYRETRFPESLLVSETTIELVEESMGAL